MKAFFLGLVLAISSWFHGDRQILSPLSKSNPKEIEQVKSERYFDKYNFEYLSTRKPVISKIQIIGKPLGVYAARQEGIDFESDAYVFTSGGRQISGMINRPKGNKLPVIIMIRGFAEAEGYFIGSGSWKAADELARNGFVTVSIDFLGYGRSDGEPKDILEARFIKVEQIVDLIESVKKLDYVDKNKVGIWSHSNGGQISLSVLEVTKGKYPTVCWAPMTKSFPESITENASQVVIDRMNEFKKEYDPSKYAFQNYLSEIKAPILIHQGTWDEFCKVEWQVDLEKKLKAFGGKITLDIVQKDNHNFSNNWDEVIKKDIKFYEDNL